MKITFVQEDVELKKIEHDSGRIEYFLDNLRHRTKGPAVIDGYVKMYFKNGLSHNLEGPAVESPKGDEYWVDGRNISRVRFVLKYKKPFLQEVIDLLKDPRSIFEDKIIREALLNFNLDNEKIDRLMKNSRMAHAITSLDPTFL